MSWSRRLAVGVMAGGLVLATAWPGVADGEAFTIGDKQVNALSGMTSDSNNQVYWVVNGGSNSTRAWAVDSKGAVAGTMSFGRRMTDPQAVVYRGGRLYVGDIGDASANRSSIHVYRYQNPTPGGSPNDVRDLELKYDDGKARDARALLVGNSGRIYVITHEGKGAVWATSSAASSRSVNYLSKIGDAPAWVTDATYLPDGRIAVRNYVAVQVLDPTGYGVAAQAPAPFQRQGEAITVGLDDKTLFLGSSGARQPVLTLNQPSGMGKIAPAGPKPPAAPQASVSPTPTVQPTPAPATSAPADGEAEAEPEATTGGAARGRTLTAAVLAAVVAVVAGAVVYFTGRPRATVRAGARTARRPAAITIAESGAEPVRPIEPAGGYPDLAAAAAVDRPAVSTAADRSSAVDTPPAAHEVATTGQAEVPAVVDAELGHGPEAEPPVWSRAAVLGPDAADPTPPSTPAGAEPRWSDAGSGAAGEPEPVEATPSAPAAPVPSDRPGVPDLSGVPAAPGAVFDAHPAAEPEPGPEPQPARPDGPPLEVWADFHPERALPAATVEPRAPRGNVTIVEEDARLARPRRAFTIVEDGGESYRPRRGLPTETEGALVEPQRSLADRQHDLDWLYPPERND